MRTPSARGLAARLIGLALSAAVGAGQAGALLEALARPAAAHCCCQARGAHQCSCPICAHARDIASDRPLLQACSAGGAAARPAPAPPVFLGFLHPAEEPLPAWGLPPHAPPRLHPPPPTEVPTPPPLA